MSGRLLFCLFVVCIGVLLVDGVTSSKKTETFVKEDLPYIGCEVCEKMVAGLKTFLDDVREHTPKKLLHELQVLEAIDYVCDPFNTTGPGAAWIKKIDIAESRSNGLSYLKLVEPGGVSKCGKECLTVAKSCELLMDNELDGDDLSAVMLKKTKFTLGDLQKKICSNLSKRCKTPAKHLDVKYRRVDVPFKAQTEKELEMEKLMASMKSMGLSSSMYGRENMDDLVKNGMGGMGGMGGMDGMDGYEDDPYGGGGGGGMYGGDGLGMGSPFGEDEEEKPFQKAGSKFEF